jgi:hypothetical protein
MSATHVTTDQFDAEVLPIERARSGGFLGGVGAVRAGRLPRTWTPSRRSTPAGQRS